MATVIPLPPSDPRLVPPPSIEAAGAEPSLSGQRDPQEEQGDSTRELLALLDHPHESVFRDALGSLMWMVTEPHPSARPRVARSLVSRLLRRATPLCRREAIADSLSGLLSSADLNGPLTEAIAWGDDEIRRVAVRALGWRGNEAAVPGLSDGVADSCAAVAREAALALGRVGGDQAVACILWHLRRPGELAVRVALCRAAGEIDPGALGAEELDALIAEHLWAPDVEVRIAASSSVRLSSEDVHSHARRALVDPEPRVRCLIVGAFGRHGDATAVACLLPRLGDRDLRVRAMARDAIEACRRAPPA